MLKISAIHNFAYTSNARNNISFSSQINNPIDEDKEQVIMLLETAKDKKGNYRFDNEDVRRISGRLSWADWFNEEDKPDFLKGLIDIGSSKGTQLETDEILYILDCMDNSKRRERDKVLKFVTHLKEKTYPACNAEYVQQNYSFEKFKKLHDETLPEDQLKKLYRERMDIEMNTLNYYAGRNLLIQKAPNMQEYFSLYNRKFIKFGVAQSQDPELMAEIVLRTGAKNDLIDKAEPLTNLYNISNNNLSPVLDFERCFSANDIEKITRILSARQSKELYVYSPVTYTKLYDNYIPKDIDLNDARKAILKKLGLLGKIKLESPTEEYIDMMDRGRRWGGSYEQGKKR